MVHRPLWPLDTNRQTVARVLGLYPMAEFDEQLRRDPQNHHLA